MLLRDLTLKFGRTLVERRLKIYIVGLKPSNRATKPLWVEAGGGAKIGGVKGYAIQPRDGFGDKSEAIRFLKKLYPTPDSLERFVRENELNPHYFSDPDSPDVEDEPIRIWQ